MSPRVCCNCGQASDQAWDATAIEANFCSKCQKRPLDMLLRDFCRRLGVDVPEPEDTASLHTTIDSDERIDIVALEPDPALIALDVYESMEEEAQRVTEAEGQPIEGPLWPPYY